MTHDPQRFIPYHTIIQAEDSTAEPRVALVLHGVLGSGQNFRGIAKRLATRVPGYSFVLVDIRNHGRSTPAPPPQTLLSCAEDLERLSEHLKTQHPELGPVRSVIGHSFGGKVALEYARGLAEPLDQVWVLDSNPGPQSPDDAHEIKNVIAAVRAVPVPVHKRQDAIDSLRASGISSGTANWMATNLGRKDQHYDWVFDLDAIELLLQDYFDVDLWPYLEQARVRPKIGLVVAAESDRWSASMRERAQRLPSTSGVRTEIIPNAGHWLHVDNPEAVLKLLADGLRS